MKCRIQWIDKQGNPTPDDRPAIGYAHVVEHDEYDPTLGRNWHTPESEHFPICAKHAEQMAGLKWWKFTPLEED